VTATTMERMWAKREQSHEKAIERSARMTGLQRMIHEVLIEYELDAAGSRRRRTWERVSENFIRAYVSVHLELRPSVRVPVGSDASAARGGL
jgi:hypothetical protein